MPKYLFIKLYKHSLQGLQSKVGMPQILILLRCFSLD